VHYHKTVSSQQCSTLPWPLGANSTHCYRQLSHSLPTSEVELNGTACYRLRPTNESRTIHSWKLTPRSRVLLEKLTGTQEVSRITKYKVDTDSQNTAVLHLANDGIWLTTTTCFGLYKSEFVGKYERIPPTTSRTPFPSGGIPSDILKATPRRLELIA